ncbi:L-propargylglycine--L-glutamate ligase BesA [Streptomyces sp. NRRL S-1448]|uniref:L-propargylglycine--L-glutamate ligase BesA n=1 Tax=Streptomyces sp. NRRL S-1448 TaxID=1463883 RepID=UPI0004BF67D5|nr:L-propargylglycine--L-glutamate ligase BesA [Streptomyces sp. NRRL S-1448]
MADFGFTRILIYAFNYADRILQEVSYLQYSAERSLCFLWDLRDPAVRAVVVTSEPVDPYTLEYHFRDVFQFDDRMIESARERLTLLTPSSDQPRPLDDLVLGEDRIVDALRGAAQESARTSIVHFMASNSLDTLARRIGADLEEGHRSFVARWGSKAGGKEILLRAGVAVPDGSAEELRSEEAVVREIERLASGPRKARRVMVKLSPDTYAASIGNVLVDCAKLGSTGDLLAAAEVIRMPSDDFYRELAGGGAIVEEFLDDVASSPSGLGDIGADGTVRFVASHDQVLSGGQYWGCRFPAEERWRPVISDAVLRTGAVLAELGHRGTFGIDFVVAGERGPLAVEINLRKVGPSHVLRYAEALVGTEVGDDGLLRRSDGQPMYYVHGRLHEPEALGRIDPRTAVERLRAEGLLYHPDKGEGVALHVLGALKSCGFVELTALAPTFEAADAYGKAARASLLRD